MYCIWEGDVKLDAVWICEGVLIGGAGSARIWRDSFWVSSNCVV
jgi:hypothetical protein